MNALFLWLSILCWTLCAAGLAWYMLTLTTQITYVTLADGRRQARALPLVFRLLLPFTPNVDPIVRAPAFAASVRIAAWQLIAAGYEGLLSAREFVALRLIIPFAAALLLAVLLFPVFGSDALLPWTMGVLLAAIWPLSWLRRARADREKQIVRALPFVLDLLTLSVEAGMDFMSAIRRNCERRVMDPLNEELLRVIREVQIGTTRKIALHNLSERLRIRQIRVLCAALIQAEDLGVGVGAILRIQSDQLRRDRFERAEKLAHEAPTKILFPLLLFIFPATIIVLLGPIVTNVIKDFL